jgi:hypothetical protein
MADGGPVIQGAPGWPANVTQTPTQLLNGATAGDGIGLYLFAGGNGDGLYVVGRGGGRTGVRSFSYAGDGVHGVALGPSPAAGVRGTSASAASASAGVVGENSRAVGVSGSGGLAGVLGEASAPDAPGVQGIHQAGGNDGVGVYGFARTGVWGDGAIGVIGQSQREFGIGVEGDASADGGIGVFGAATGNRGGVGVYATAPSSSSAALQVNGRAVFSSSGRLVVPAGATSASQAGVVLGPASLVLALLQENLPGIAVRAAVPDPTAGSVTVHLTQAPPADTVVGWMVVN